MSDVDAVSEDQLPPVPTEAAPAPPVPSTQAPPPPTIDEQAAQATNLEDFEEEARLYSLVQQDPRYVRWLRKLCPKLISTQKLRSLVDPSSIPMVGIGVNLYRAQDTYGHKSQLQKFEGGMTDSKMEQMNEAANVETASLTTKAAVSATLHAVPLGQLLGPLTDIVGGVAAQAATPLIKMAVSKAAQTAAKTTTATTTQSRGVEIADKSIFQKWGGTRAFFMYLGYPATEDELYARWETARLKLKHSYGAAPEDDLFIMKPKGELKKKLRIMEKERGEYLMNELPGVSLLMLLWRTFRCWDLPYFDMLEAWTYKGRSGFNLNDDAVRKKVREIERKQDYDIIQKMLHPDDPHVMRLKGKLIKKEAATMLLDTYADTPRMNFLADTLPKEKKKVAIKPPAYMLHIEFVEARDLVAADMITGTSDPYAVAHMLGATKEKGKHKKVKTRIVMETLEPHWNVKKELAFHTLDEVLEVYVCDYDRFHRNECIGKCYINTIDLPDGEEVDAWYPLKYVKHGEIHLKITRQKVESPSTEAVVERKPKKWLSNYLIAHFCSNGQGWVYYDENKSPGLQAAILFEPPKKRISVNKALAKSSVMGTFHLGGSGYKQVCAALSKEEAANEKLRKTLAKQHKKLGVVHWVMYRDLAALHTLLQAVANNPYPTVYLVYPKDMPDLVSALKGAPAPERTAEAHEDSEKTEKAKVTPDDTPIVNAPELPESAIQFLYRPSPSWFTDEDRKSKNGVISASLKKGLTSGKGALSNAGTSVSKGVSGALSASGHAVGSGFGAVGSGVGKMGSGVYKGLGDSAGHVGTGVHKVGSSVGKGVGNVGSGIGSGVSAVGSGVGSGVGKVGSGVGKVGSGVGSGVGKVGSGVGSGVGKVGSGVGSGVGKVGSGVGSGVGKVGSGVGSGVGKVGSGVGSGVGKVGSGVGAGLKKVGGSLNLKKSKSKKKASESQSTNSSHPA